VLISYGIQGSDYFRGIVEHFDAIGDGVRAVMGFVWERHAGIYRRALRGKAEVEILFRGKPYGEDGPTMPWIICWKGQK